MSIGIGAYANLVLQDSNTVIYEYGCYNLNEKNIEISLMFVMVLLQFSETVF